MKKKNFFLRWKKFANGSWSDSSSMVYAMTSRAEIASRDVMMFTCPLNVAADFYW